MNFFLLTLGVILGGLYAIALKPANSRCRAKSEVELFNGGVTLVATLCAAAVCLYKGSFSMPLSGILTFILFGIIFSATVFLNLIALEYGPLSLTNLLVNFSLIIPLGYSFVFYQEALTLPRIIGILLFAVCMVLFSGFRFGKGMKGEQAAHEKKASLKWFLLSVLAMICNGSLSLIQKVYAMQTGNIYSSQVLFYGYLFATLSSFVLAAVLFSLQRRRHIVLPTHKEKQAPVLIGLALLVGLSNFGLNLVVVLLATRMDAAIVYPVIQGSGPIIVTVVSRLLFKEKIDAVKLAGILIGCTAIVLLNL